MKNVMFVFALLLLAFSAAAETVTVDFKINKSEPFYKTGEKIVVTATPLVDGKAAAGKSLRCHVMYNTKTVKYIKKVDSGNPIVLEHTPDAPGFLCIRIYYLDENGKIVKQKFKRGNRVVTNEVCGGYGVMVDPEKLTPSVAEPADFDEFWNQVKADLAKLPLKEIERKQIPNKVINIYDVKIPCIGDKPVSGFLCMPKNAKPKSLPAIVTYHGAGVYTASQQVGRAAAGWIALDINAHGIENGHPKKYYDDLRASYFLPKGKPGYPHWGKENRDTFYFKGMFARVIRSLEYVKSLPEWDGKHLVVSGGSQGGAQVLVAAGLDKDVTFAVCTVPAMCDHGGCTVGHVSGWPRLYSVNKNGKISSDAVAKTAGYFDGVNFAKRIKCPIHFSTGGYDLTCSPTSVYKAYNSVPAGVKKHLDFTPDGNHGGSPVRNSRELIQKHIGK